MAIRNAVKKCLECGEEFEALRSDQKYCDTVCKNTFNNKKKMLEYHASKEENEICKGINKILFRNRNILKPHVGKKITLVEIEKQGFRTNWITSFKEADADERIKFACYDVGYQFINDKELNVFSIKFTN